MLQHQTGTNVRVEVACFAARQLSGGSVVYQFLPCALQDVKLKKPCMAES